MAISPTLLPLDSLRTEVTRLALELWPIEHQVTALPQDPELEYYFLPQREAHRFADLHRPGKPFGNVKLVNYDKPAIALSFFSKHRYALRRDPRPDEIFDHLQAHREYLYNRSFLENLTPPLEAELRRTDELLRALRQGTGAYQFCFSNYHQYYRYWYCSYRYFEDADQIQTSTENEHLLKHTKGSRRSPPRESVNLIFVDTEQITRPVAYDNKRIDRELDLFPERFEHGSMTLYARRIDVPGGTPPGVATPGQAWPGEAPARRPTTPD